MNKIQNYYFPIKICNESQRQNLSQYYEITIIHLPQNTLIGTKVNGSYTIKLNDPYARNISAKFNVNEDRYHEQYITLKQRYDKTELNKHIYKLYNDVIASEIIDRICYVNRCIMNSNIIDDTIPTFFLTKAQFVSRLIYHAGQPSKDHYTKNLFANFIDGRMPAYSQRYSSETQNTIVYDYDNIRRDVIFFRDDTPLRPGLLYHNEYDTPLKHGFYVHNDDKKALIRYGIYKSLKESVGVRTTEVYYDSKGQCVSGSDALFCYGTLSFPILYNTTEEFDQCVENFKAYATEILFNIDRLLLNNLRPRISMRTTLKTLFPSDILPDLRDTDIPTAANLFSDVRMTQILCSTPGNFCNIEFILDKLKLEMLPGTIDSYNGDWSIPHTSIIPYNMGYNITNSSYRERSLIYDDTIQPMRGYGNEKEHYSLWLQKQEDENILMELLKFSNIMRPDLYQIDLDGFNRGTMQALANSFASMIKKYKTVKINKSTSKLLFLLSSIVLNSYDKRSNEPYRPVFSLSVLFLGAITEPMVAIARSMGYRVEGMGLNAQSPNILKQIQDCNPGAYSIIISDIDFVALGEDEFINCIMNMINLYNAVMAIKILHVSAKLNRILLQEKVNCYFAQLPMSSGFNERWLIVNEKGIHGSYVETDGFNMFYGTDYDFYVTNRIITDDNVFRPQIFSGILDVQYIPMLASYSDDIYVSQIGDATTPAFNVTGVISTKSRNRGLLGTKLQEFNTILARSRNVKPKFTSSAANVFDVYLDALLLEAINEFYDLHKTEITILDIGGRCPHDLPTLYIPYTYKCVNITRDEKYDFQLDAIYDSDKSFYDNMMVFIGEMDLPYDARLFVIMRNFVFALPKVVESLSNRQDFINDVKKWNSNVARVWMNYFGYRQGLNRCIPTLKVKGWNLFEESRRHFKTLTFNTYPIDDVLTGLIENPQNMVLKNPNYFSDVIEENGFSVSRAKYVTSMYLLNLLQIFKSP